MITTGSLPNYTNSVSDINISVDSPISGFELSLMETGILSTDGSFKTANLVTFLIKAVIFLEATKAGSPLS